MAERVGLTSVDATAKQSLPPTKANENNQYFVYVFYTDPREADAKAVADALAAAGFRVTKVATKLIETKLNQAPGSTFILPSQGKGKKIRDDVQKIVRQNLPSPRDDDVTLGGAYDIKVGDIQVQLY